MLERHKRVQSKILKIFQANVGRGQTNHDLALALAHAENIDVILLQEPWILNNSDKRVTKNHHDFEVFSPTDSWEIRPRVLIYVRKGRNLCPEQHRPADTTDICWVKLTGVKPPVTITNVYRPPQENIEGPVISILKEWQVPRNCIIAGDFNTRHPIWDSRAEATGRAEELVNWMQNSDLDIISPINLPTHDRGSTLDLTFSNILGANCTIEEHLHTTSDHETLLTTVNLRCLSTTPHPRFKETPESLLRMAAGVRETLPPPHLFPEDLDDLAILITKAIQCNMSRFIPQRKSSKIGTRWWNDDCANRAAEYRLARRSGDACMEKQALRKATREAKKKMWQSEVQNASKPSQIFKIMRWHKTRGNFSNPPIKHADRSYTGSLEKAKILRHTLLERRTSSEDVPERPIPGNLPSTIEVKSEVIEEEVRQCLLHTSNTSPGADGITVKILESCWDSIKDIIVHLFRRCLLVGYHPKIFRSAEVIFIPKPNKRDLTSPRSWRPISLLSCLGKGLERLVAQRVSIAAITQKTLHPQQFGALRKRSAIDLVGCLIHDVEKARARKHVASLLTMDIKGAFDTVLPGRLQNRLCEQGWPGWLIRWVTSFISQRSAKIRFENIFTEDEPLTCGLPQGSPISPILFLLYTEPILKLVKWRTKYAYADDLAILRTGPSLSDCTKKLSADIALIMSWGEQNAISFDLDKTELQHFTVAPKPKEYPGMHVQGVPILANQSTRWLGIWLDRKLSFLDHATKWSAKGISVSGFLRRLNNTQRGSSPQLVRQAIKACVIPVVLYGAEVWYPGTTEFGSRNGKHFLKNSRNGKQVSRLNRAIISGLRAVLPVYKTTPLPILYRESGILPAFELLKYARIRQALRIRSLDELHPLRQRAFEQVHTRLTQVANLLPGLQDSDIPLLLQTIPSPQKSICPSIHDIHLYTDGSCNSVDSSGGGYIAYQGGQKVISGKFRLHNFAAAVDAEITAIAEGIEAVIRNCPTHFARNLIVFSDNKTAVDIGNGRIPLTSQVQALRIRQFQKDWLLRRRLPHVAPGMVAFEWISGHSNNLGNDEADRLAKLGSKLPVPSIHGYTYAASKEIARTLITKDSEDWWEKHAPLRYKRLGIALRPNPRELTLARNTLSKLIAARSGHGDFKQYHVRFHHYSFDSCECGSPTSPEHFFFCRITRHKARKATDKRRTKDAIDWLLGTESGALAFASIWAGDHR